MGYYVVKVFFSAIVLVTVAELAKRNSVAAALIAALPLTSLLAFIWLHFEGASSEAIGTLSGQIFWLVIPSLALFWIFPVLLRFGLNFWLSLGLSSLVTATCYVILLPVLRRFGVQL